MFSFLNGPEKYKIETRTREIESSDRKSQSKKIIGLTWKVFDADGHSMKMRTDAPVVKAPERLMTTGPSLAADILRYRSKRQTDTITRTLLGSHARRPLFG